eukprot:CAMPEP_0202029606 /NCGR_PEP_ID=MMETSP0905-20130828/64068_1 /ASSEMBLY_ACC=CAM_ASM_000554 /TAXON_ID=420261 /ORGANISM="Thalassiosira antarctica, Strain CCMP982" /LENGTH=160 /DNA_ID=CAMNT_0048593377 /DNA_START=193 /DNA_END=675 /DNA_ORIENTATION=+
MQGIHPLVRDLYKRAVIVGKDYPHPEGLEYVRRKWKEALRDPENCQLIEGTSPDIAGENERILRKAVGRGRYVIREMEGTIQLKKYRTMRRRYGEGALINNNCILSSTNVLLFFSKVIREMEGTIQLKKYRTMRRRYGEGVDVAGETSRIVKSVNDMLKE